MTRVQLHNRAVEHVRRVLTGRGFLRAQRGGRRGGEQWRAERFDLIAEDVTIAVRVARLSVFPWQVSVRGKRYQYRYRGHRWNLHTHGSTKLRPDVWVFVTAEDLGCFVVPGRRVRGFYTLTLRERSKTWLLDCENRWQTIREVALTRQEEAA